MNDIEILRDMIVLDAQVKLQQEYGKTSAKLTDRQAQTAVTIKGLPLDSIVIRSEEFKEPLTIFSGSKGERARSDFVIVSNKGTKKWIICIETQASQNKMAWKVKNQLKGARCFMIHCKCIGGSFWESDKFLKDYQCRFVSIACVSVNKRPTRLKKHKAPLHENPENFLKIFGNSHHFDKLVNKLS